MLYFLIQLIFSIIIFITSVQAVMNFGWFIGIVIFVALLMVNALVMEGIE